ncbi:adenosine deaminase family protein [Sphingomonas sp. ID0503]|uniref:adenosine deaminase family protein n=1 Tax=Sphingomonas sp. ID0503 TaxID=3399691 RepID=UPI003AFAA815
MKAFFSVLVFALAAPAAAQSPVEALFDTVKASPPRLRVFLQAMPKGADLHNHLWGAPYAEEFIAWGATDGLCLRGADLTFVPAPCGEGAVPLAGLSDRDPALYRRTIDSLSTRAFARGVGRNERTGHTQFFDSFDKFAGAAIPSIGRMVASARDKAAGDNVQYLELMSNPEAVHLTAMKAAGTAWDGDFDAAYRRVGPLLPDAVKAAVKETDAAEAEAAKINECLTQKPARGACAVTVRYLPFALRSQAPAYVFGQMAVAFALAEADWRYVGVNIVAPEDGPVSTRDYDLHMAMFAYFHKRFPKVPLALHAGEVTLGLVPPAELRGRIRKAVEVAGASRIGHGVDIAFESDSAGLLKEMAAKGVAVEINLTSNDTILGVKGRDHPLALYRAAGVPVVLSTDDEGVSRSDMTNEYLRAVTEQGLGYAELKAIAKAGIEHAFLPPKEKGEQAAKLDAAFDRFEAEVVEKSSSQVPRSS